MLEIIILFVGLFGISLLGLLVFLANPKSSSNRRFTFLAVSLAIWPVFNYLSLHNDNHLLYIRIVMAIAVCIITSFYLFAVTFPQSKLPFTKQQKIVIIYAGITVLAALSPWLFTAIAKTADGHINPIPGPAMFLFVVLVLYFMPAGLWSLRSHYKFANTLLERIQLRGLYYSSLLLFSSILFMNFVMPLAFHREYLIPFGPAFNLVFVAAMSYAVVKMHLFEVRSIVARSLAYTLLIASLSAIYSVLIFVTAHLFFNNVGLNLAQQILYVVLAMFVAFTFQPIKHFFDRVTNKLFFRDAYNTKEVLNLLSSLLATEIDLDKLISGSSAIINRYLRPTYLRQVVFKDGDTYVDYAIGERQEGSEVNRKLLANFDSILINKYDLPEGHLRNTLDKLNAEILLKLTSSEDIIGAIILGPKQTGSVYTQQDIDVLTISEKELAVAIQNSRNFEQIQEFNIKLQREVEKATSELRASNKRLKELDEAKDEFVSMASHQLRTPLTAVKGYLSMVLEGDVGKLKKDQTKMLQEAFASSQRMVYLIADLLNVSRLKTGKFMIAQSKISLADIVEQEVEQLRPTARSRRLKLLFDKPARFPLVMLDETKTRQVIMNFIDNAIYYTKPGGTIDVRLTAKKDRLEYTVKDTGIGVPKADRPQLFTKFFRASNARKARPDGTGLGLYMAQRVISAQGGNIIFDSIEGKGSTFGFSFPRNKIEVKKPTRKKSTKR